MAEPEPEPGAEIFEKQLLTLEAVEEFIRCGHDVNIRDKEGNTLLLKAVKEDFGESNVEVIDLLIEKGADPTLGNKAGETPLKLCRPRYSSPKLQIEAVLDKPRLKLEAAKKLHALSTLLKKLDVNLDEHILTELAQSIMHSVTEKRRSPKKSKKQKKKSPKKKRRSQRSRARK